MGHHAVYARSTPDMIALGGVRSDATQSAGYEANYATGPNKAMKHSGTKRALESTRSKASSQELKWTKGKLHEPPRPTKWASKCTRLHVQASGHVKMLLTRIKH